MLNQIVTPPIIQRNHPNPPFRYAACSQAAIVEIPETKPMKRQSAEALLLDIEKTLKDASTGLACFRLAIGGPCSREDFEKMYKRHIIENGLQVWLSPGEAAEIWAAVRAVGGVENE